MINETAEEESESIFLWKYDNRFLQILWREINLTALLSILVYSFSKIVSPPIPAEVFDKLVFSTIIECGLV